MRQIAVIPGAGWKTGEIEVQLPKGALPSRCPELLWPLADGNTILSRLVKQLRSLDTERILVAVGDPENYHTEKWEDKIARSRNHTCPRYGESPWTQERVDMVRALGVDVLLVADPLYYSCQHTMWQLLEHVDGWEWDRVVGLAGDYVFQTEFLRQIVLGAQWPSIHWILPVHDILLLNRSGHRVLLRIMRPLGAMLSGTYLWVDREDLARRGIRNCYVTKQMWKEYAPWVGAARLPDPCNPSFVEVGTKLNEWGAAQILAARDPI